MGARLHPNVDVVFIGAGPVGLWTAIQTKLRDPRLEIHVLEKRAVYRRSHVLNISSSSLQGTPPQMHAFVEQLRRQRNPRANEIENQLEQLAERVGVVVRKNIAFTNPSDLEQAYPHTQVIVGADGAHSAVRRTVFHDEMRSQEDFNFIIEMKYEVQGQGKRLQLLREAYPTFKIMKTIAQEHVGKEKDGKTAITLRMLINRESYQQLQGADLQNPYTLNNREFIQQDAIRGNMQLWLNLKAARLGERRIVGSEQITVTRLGVYASKQFVKTTQSGVTYCLVGDAALGVPFFSNLKIGLRAGTYLSKRIVETVSPQKRILSRSVFSPMQRYSRFVTYLSKKEILIAKIKQFFLSFLLFFVKMSARVPWQVNYWSEGRIQRLRFPPASA